MRLVRVEDLNKGMIIAKDVESSDGLVIIGKNSMVTESARERLKGFDIKYVFIKSDESTIPESDPNYTEKQKFANNVKVISDNFVGAFNDIRLGKKLVINHISDNVDSIIEDMGSINDILSRIRNIESDAEYTYQHSIKVCSLSLMMGKWLKLDKIDMKHLGMAALLHDVGKAKIPEHILNKPGALTQEEFAVMKKHSTYGYEIAEQTKGLAKAVALAVLQHHERMDGSGYPLGKSMDKINLLSRIIAIADIFDAITSDRVYKKKKTPFVAADIIREQSFKELDPTLANLFLSNTSVFYVGNKVILSTKEIGEIVYINRDNPTSPLIKISEDRFVDTSKDKQIVIEDIVPE